MLTCLIIFFRYGQLSGMVEPIAGVIILTSVSYLNYRWLTYFSWQVLGAVLVTVLEPVLPWALAFAAGAMVYVVISDIIPEAHQGWVKQLIKYGHISILIILFFCFRGFEKLANWSAMVGFVVMMCLDVGLGWHRLSKFLGLIIILRLVISNDFTINSGLQFYNDIIIMMINLYLIKRNIYLSILHRRCLSSLYFVTATRALLRYVYCI